MQAPNNAAARIPTRYWPLRTASSIKKGRRNRRQSTRQAIHVVQQVHGVGDTDHPHNRDCIVDPGPGQGHNVDTGNHQDDGRGDLTEQFDPGRHAALVVDQTQKRHKRRADEDTDQLADVEPVAQEDQGQHERHINGHTPQQRRWFDMHLARVGMIDHVEAVGHLPSQGRTAEGQDEGGHDDQDFAAHFGCSSCSCCTTFSSCGLSALLATARARCAASRACGSWLVRS